MKNKFKNYEKVNEIIEKRLKLKENVELIKINFKEQFEKLKLQTKI